jgi:hypothetical protein
MKSAIGKILIQTTARGECGCCSNNSDGRLKEGENRAEADDKEENFSH